MQSMFKIAVIFLTFNFWGATAMAENKTPPTFGFVPASFPRDPVDIDIYQEHIAVGQIIEPLVTTDREGNITPGLAEKWWIATDGKKMIFTLKKGLVFSTGAPVTAEDVKFSIERHLKNKSQSRPYLQCIDSINVTDVLLVEFNLCESQPAIIKALSRDHLGILPKGWVFNKESAEPYVGTGPYRAVKQADGWHFIANEKYRNKIEGMILDWRILLTSDPVLDVHAGVIPDYVPYTSKVLMEAIKEKLNTKLGDYNVRPAVHFTQTSAWWYPHGKHYKDMARRECSLKAFKVLLGIRRKALGFEASTGPIPKGIQGYLPTEVEVTQKTNCPAIGQLVIKVAVSQKDIGLIFEKNSVVKVEKLMNVRFLPYLVPQVQGDSLKLEKPDIIVASWAGGFNDPDGFLPILTKILDVDLVGYLGGLASLYLDARKEVDWSKRTKYYQELNKKIVQSYTMIPAWKDDVFTVVKNNLLVSSSIFRYSVKLEDVTQIASSVLPNKGD
jgi:ABC-type transport system substrate-binding protein